MLGDQVAALRDETGKGTAASCVIGVCAGVFVAMAAVASNTEVEPGFIGTLAGNTVGASVIVVVAAALGAAVGGVVGALEGGIAFAAAHRSAKYFRPLWTLVAGLAIAFVAVNMTIAIVLTVLVFGVDDTQFGDVAAPTVAAGCTVLALLVFARLQATDWPKPHPHVQHPLPVYADQDEPNYAITSHTFEKPRDREDHPRSRNRSEDLTSDLLSESDPGRYDRQ